SRRQRPAGPPRARRAWSRPRARAASGRRAPRRRGPGAGARPTGSRGADSEPRTWPRRPWCLSAAPPDKPLDSRARGVIGCRRMRALVCELSVPRQVVTSLLGRIDKRFFFGPFSPATLRELPEPELPAPDWVTIRTRLCGICGSDYKQMFLNGSMDNPMTAVISFPQVLGHEVVGTIERVGPPVRARRAGERVVLNPGLSCAPRGIDPPCPACREGQYSICHNFARGALPPGIHTGNSSNATGGFAPHVPAHESMCIAVPDAVTDEDAVLADPFSVSLHGFLKRRPAPGATALVYGCGTLGLMAIAILRALAPATRVLAIARFPHQKALAERSGAALVLPHDPLVPLIERIAVETGAQLMRPRHG